MAEENFNKEKIIERISDIKNAVLELERFQKMDLEEFLKDSDNYNLSAYHLRIAVEAVLIIGTHILSRIPQNGKKKDYTQVILTLADYNVLPKDFSQKIKGMAGYRNRLVHLYWKIEPKELLSVIKEDLSDLEEFIGYIKKFLQNN
ncbi:MAG: hypothetical protein A3G45_01400 [Candidatus Staskawiczbacteria bacterium RIFCSPLOWO2_12_FULL_37_15]|uniref:DUF86 domain-containing protein n=1 Tax=Candidatus Staskawiczbacteria bacterium RIFCSPLOWO2_12_FULL_37_15 TaxID=1802218 RepID=A0A1G2IS35_9BACT|nr:MAG: hypothetical protein US35_C0018G0017 [Parcubacteria group bacterium GW2011_GWA2_37_10]OGZ77709.1 MAG: hypothetical protein A3G45_01400 [Candidatus Staskawiczbacteria bacterium RIFCSPLOWO2_12_FULL_37_15]HLD38668.1 DUF86 domain-containing protein [Candidatus Nanoarchaeia archaeon]